MYHSITFGTKNTWTDWHLIPESRPVVSPPSPKTNFVEIPGGDGTLDLTESLYGRTTYSDRQGSFSFIVQNGFKDWNVLYSEIMEYLHGKSMIMILEDDPSYYYEGRFVVSGWSSGKDYSTISIKYQVGPFKKSTTANNSDWMWDPFSFIDGEIKDYRNLKVNGTRTITVTGTSISVPLRVIAYNSGLTVTCNGTVYSLSLGYNTLSAIQISSTAVSLVFSGSGSFTIEYDGGVL